MSTPVLEWTANAPGASAAENLGALRSIVLVHCAVQAWAFALQPLPPPITFPVAGIYLVAVSLTLFTGLSLFDRGQFAARAATPLVAWEVAWLFPYGANHTMVSLILLSFFAFLNPKREEEEALLLQSLRWIAVIVFFYAGLQKVLHGLYFRGEFLAWAISRGAERWVDFFGLLISRQEMDHLASLSGGIGSGPYRIDSLPFMFLTNGVWVAEIAFAVAMLFRRSREVAALAAIGLTFAIQSAPREFMFAFLYASLLLLFVRGDWIRRVLYFVIAFHLYLLATIFGAPGESILLRPNGTI